MSSDFDQILNYCSAHSTPASDALTTLERTTHLETLSPQMISGHVQGRFLSFISKMIQPKNILELGSFTGYSTLCLCEGLQSGGKAITIEGNIELEKILRTAIENSIYKDQVELHIGQALDIIPTLRSKFDLVFIDASKLEYSTYFELIIENMTDGGVMIVDNVLWYNKVLSPDADKKAQALDAFNKMVLNDRRVENVVLPLRDGLQIIRKLSSKQ